MFAFCFSAFFVSMSFVLVQLQVIDFDRYYLAVLLPLFSVVAVVWRWLGVRPVWALALIACFAIVIYATTLQQHYMSWNRARWNAVAELEKNGINSDNIDGGAEYIFWTDPSIFSLVKTRIGNPYFSRQTRGAAPQNDLRWWPVKGEDYILSFDSLPGCDVYGRQPFWSSVLNRQSCIYVLKRRPDFNPGKAREGGHVK